MEKKITELEKTILLAFLSLAKSPDKYVRKDEVVAKFPLLQRKIVGRFIDKLEKKDFLVKHYAGKSYKLSESGVKRASRLLVEGASLWRDKK